MRTRRALLPFVLTCALLLGACGGSGGSAAEGGSESGSTPNSGEIDLDGTFRYAFVQNPTSLDPARSSNGFDLIFLRLAYDQLIWRNDAGDLEPMLATSWEFVDEGSALELTLREDVDFIDGEHFDAETVKLNLERTMTLPESVHLGALSRIDSIEVLDEYEVRINLNGPGGNLPDLLSSNLGSMISPGALDNDDLDQNPVGSGMASLVEYIPGQVSRWERNDDYWQEDVALAKTYEVYIQTASPTRLNMLTTGQIELTYLLPQDQDAAEAAGMNVAPSVSTTIFTLILNAGKESIEDPRVRHALELAMDREALIDGVFFGAGTPVAQHLPPDHWAYHPGITPDDPEYGYNPERAKELLAEAGYADGLDVEMIIPSLDDHRAVAEALVPMFAEVGITASSQVVEAANTGVIFYSQQEGDFLPGARPPILDPTNHYQGNLPGQFSNPSENTSPEFIAAWEASLEGETREDRLPGIHAMIEEDKELRNVIPLLHFYPPSAWGHNVVFPEGYQPAYAPHFRGVGVTGN